MILYAICRALHPFLAKLSKSYTRSEAPALRLGDEEIPESLHAGDVLHFLGVDEEAIHLRHVGLRQQADQAESRRHAIVRQDGDADAVLDRADDGAEIVDRDMRRARVLGVAPDGQKRIEIVEEMR